MIAIIFSRIHHSLNLQLDQYYVPNLHNSYNVFPAFGKGILICIEMSYYVKYLLKGWQIP